MLLLKWYERNGNRYLLIEVLSVAIDGQLTHFGFFGRFATGFTYIAIYSVDSFIVDEYVGRFATSCISLSLDGRVQRNAETALIAVSVDDEAAATFGAACVQITSVHMITV